MYFLNIDSVSCYAKSHVCIVSSWTFLRKRSHDNATNRCRTVPLPLNRETTDEPDLSLFTGRIGCTNRFLLLCRMCIPMWTRSRAVNIQRRRRERNACTLAEKRGLTLCVLSFRARESSSLSSTHVALAAMHGRSKIDIKHTKAMG